MYHFDIYNPNKMLIIEEETIKQKVIMKEMLTDFQGGGADK